jgi:hydrogenase maturation protease
MLILGCGNRQRGDDAAGILAAERLRAIGITAEVCAGEASELMHAWSVADDVIVIDAVVTGAPAGTVHVWDGQHLPAFATSTGSSHGLGVAQAIGLARALDCLPARLRVYGIEAKRFELGSEVSPEVERAVEEVVRRIAGGRGKSLIYQRSLEVMKEVLRRREKRELRPGEFAFTEFVFSKRLG